MSAYDDRTAVPADPPADAAIRTLDALLAYQAARNAAMPAIVAPGRVPLLHRGLSQQIADVRRALRRAGIARGDRVAVMLGPGAETAATVVAVAASAACVPINPACPADELALHLELTNARAIVVDDAFDAAARAVAESRGIALLPVAARREQPAGTFALAASRPGSGCFEDAFASPSDIALVLLTSGTTSRPKVVALTHANVCASTDNIARTLELTGRDRCLDVNPLYHIHGIMVALASLASGGSVVAMPPLETPRFMEWMDEVAPTWYSAVPTVHQAILAAVRRTPLRRPRQALRFIRSSSSSLPVGVLAELERVFAAPVIESYGMTEACHQIASNPLPPRARKPGTVGTAAGSSIAILDERGRELPAGQVGEVAVRGASVIRRYESPIEANAEAFAGEWLRTGDLGRVDEEGYLSLTGRIKELVNRGGEKISPHEVETVFAAHPAVAQVVAFAVPHPALGEEVGVAAVLREGHAVSERELKSWGASRLAEIKRPRRIAVVGMIPTGPTGKFQRRLLASQLAMIDSTSSPDRTAARGGRALDTLEAQLVELWERLLDTPVGVRDDFFDLGGHSLLAAEMLDEVEEMTGIALPPATLHEATTIEALAGVLIANRRAPHAGPELVVLSQGGERPPFVLLHGDYNGGGFYCRRIAKRLDARQPFIVCAPHGTNGDALPPTIEAMAEDLAGKVEAAVPHGPIVLGGFSQAGFVALEIAQRLRARGRVVEGLVVIDKPVDHPRWRLVAAATGLLARLRAHDIAQRRDAFLRWQYRVRRLMTLARSGPAAQLRYLLVKLGAVRVEPARSAQRVAAEAEMLGRRQRHLFDAYEPIVDAYVPRRYPGPVLLVTSHDGYARLSGDPALGWRNVSRDVVVRRVPGDHLTVVTTHVDALATCLDEWLGTLPSNASSPRPVPLPPNAANDEHALAVASRQADAADLR